MAKYLDGAGLDVVWGQIKNTFYSKSGGSIGGDVSLVYGAANSDQMIRFSAAGSDPQSVYLGIRRPVASYGPSYKDTAGNWYKLLHEGNYTSFTVKKDGTGASGTWGISISGNATTATTADTLDGEHLMTKVTDWDTRSLSIFKSSENNASNRPSGSGYLYGTTLRFHRDTSNYYTDLVVNLYGDNLYFRRHTESGYGNWRELIHSGNIGSQSVSYATSSGSSSTATSLDPESLSDLDSGTKWRFFHTSSAQPQHSPVSGNSWFNGITFASNNSNSYKQQLAIGLDNPHMYFRNMKNDGSGTWNSWTTVLDSGNYTSYTVQKDGTGANGIWSISIYGNAATATETDKLSWYNYGRANLDDVKGLHDGSVRYILQGNGLRGLHFSWDSGNYDTQIQIPDHKYNSSEHLKWRSNGEDGTWENWMTILDSSNYTSYAATSGHTHTSLVLSSQDAEDSCVPSDAQRVGVFLSTSSYTGGGDGYITTWKWSNGNWLTQLFVDVDPTYNVSLRHRNSAGEWTSWKRFAMGDGTGAGGTWGINVTGSAGSVAWSNITSRPRVFENLGWNSSSSCADADATNMAIGIVMNRQGNAPSSITNYPTNYGYLVSLNPEAGNTYTGIQLYQGTDDLTRVRYRWSSSTWGGWRVLLDSSNYTTYAATASHNHDGTYLKLSGGGTITGGYLNISSGADRKIYLNNTDSETYWSLISFQDNGTEYGTLGTRGDTDLRWNGYTVYHAGNLTPSTIGAATSSHNHDGTYLKLSSASSQQAITGPIRINDDLGGNLANWVTYQHSGPFEVGRSSNAMTVAIGVTDDNYGYIQTKGYGITTPGDLVLLPGGGNLYYDLSKKPILHSGNYSNYALPLSGGTLSGALRLSQNKGGILSADGAGAFLKSGQYWIRVHADGGLDYTGNTIWHAGNDGSGSGLDADLLDGKHATYFWNYKTPSKSSGNWDVNEVRGDTIAAWAYGYSDSTSVVHGPVGDNVSDARAYYTLGGVYCPLQLSWFYLDPASLYARTYYNGTWYSWKKVAFTEDLTWGNITGKPDSYTPAAHNHDSTYLKLSGGTVTGNLQVNSTIFAYRYSTANGSSAPAIVFDKPGGSFTGIGCHGTTDTIWFGAVSGDYTWNDSKKQIWDFNGTIKQQGVALGSRAFDSTDYLPLAGGTLSGHLKLSGTKNLSSTWDPGVIAGSDGHDKVVLTYLASNTNAATIGGHNSALSAWAPLYIGGTNVYIGTSETKVLTVSSSQNVGIGKTNPGYKLDVAGRTLITGGSNAQSNDKWVLKVVQGTDNGSGNYDTVVFSSNDVCSLRISESDGTQLGLCGGDSHSTFTSTHDFRFYTGCTANDQIYSGGGGTLKLGLNYNDGTSIHPVYCNGNTYINGTITTAGGAMSNSLSFTQGAQGFISCDSQGIFIQSGSYYLRVNKNSGTAEFTGNTIWHTGNDGSGSGLDADKLDGYHLSQITPVVTKRNFSNGTLVKTDISFPGTNTSVSEAFLLTVKGNGYGGGIVNFEFQGYVYYTSSYANPQIISSDFIIYSPNSIDKIYTMSIDNKLCFWWARQSYWQGFHIFCTTNTELYQNRVTEVQDVSKPSGLFEQSYTPRISLTSSNYTDFTVTKTGTGASGTWGINITGNADTVDNEHASAFAHIGAHNNLTASGNEFTFASSGFSGEMWINYRTAGGYNGNITNYILGNGNGESLGYILTSGNYTSYCATSGHNHDSTYLKLSGGTITGTLESTGTKLVATNQAYNTSISLFSSQNVGIWNEKTSSWILKFDGSWLYRNDKKIWDEGNLDPSSFSSASHNHDSTYLKLIGGWMDWGSSVKFKGLNGSTSAYGYIGYDTGANGYTMHCTNATTGYQSNGALYIKSNGCNSANDWGGIAIDNEGVTVFGAGDPGDNFTGVFRVLNEDNVADGPQFLVTKASGCTSKYSMTASSFIKSGGTSSQFLKADGSVDSTAYTADSAITNAEIDNIMV